MPFGAGWRGMPSTREQERVGSFPKPVVGKGTFLLYEVTLFDRIYQQRTMMQVCFSQLRLSIGFLIVTSTLSTPYGIQTTDTRSSYAGAIQYNASNNIVYVTGSTYGSFWNPNRTLTTSSTSSCFFGMLQLPTTTGDARLPPSWIYKTTLGVTNTLATCSSMAALNSKVYLGGWTEPNGLLNELIKPGQTYAPQYGTVLDLDIHFNGKKPSLTTTEFKGGTLTYNDDDSESTVAMALSPVGDVLYIASYVADDSSLRTDGSNTDQPNYSTGGKNKRGSHYYASLRRLSPTPSNSTETFQIPRIQNEFDTEQKNEIPAGIGNIAGLLHFNSTMLIMAGSAKGFNKLAFPLNDALGVHSNGYISLFQSSDLNIIGGMRIQSQGERDVYIRGLCMNPGESFVYVVGITKATFTYDENVTEVSQAFIHKIHPDTLKIIWTADLTANLGTLSGNVEGLSCSVTSDGIHVYLGGVVKDGATVGNHVTQGGDDFVVVQYTTDLGTFVWDKQLGTQGNEFLSDTVCDNNGNLIVFGNTDGNYFRNREQGVYSDVVVLAIDRVGGDAPVSIDESQITNSAGNPTTPVPLLDTTPSQQSSQRHSGVLVLTSMVCVGAVVMACFVVQRRRRRRRKRESYPDSTHVLDYLRGFDNVEVDLKHSASGGYHGTYVNHDGGPRFYRDEPEQISFGNEMSPLTYDPIVEQSLFCIDDDDAPSFGGTGSLQRQSSNYDGLMDAYNNAWGDLSPHTLPDSSSSSSRSPPQRITSSRHSRLAHSIVHEDLMEVNIHDTKNHWGREII